MAPALPGSPVGPLGPTDPVTPFRPAAPGSPYQVQVGQQQGQGKRLMKDDSKDRKDSEKEQHELYNRIGGCDNRR